MSFAKKIWKPISIFLTAVGAINIVDEIFPALINLSDILTYFLIVFKRLRDIVLIPITFPLIQLFDFEIFDWLRTYLFLGLLLFNTYNTSYRIICGHLSKASPFNIILSDYKLRTLLIIIFRIFVWPYTLIELVRHYLTKGYKREQNVITLWGKYIFRVFIVALAISLLNWLYVGVFEDYKVSNNKDITQSDTSSFDNKTEEIIKLNLIRNKKMPYLESVPIIDTTLFIENFYTRLEIGGVNIDQLKLNARTRNGAKLKILYDDSRKLYYVDIFKEPVLELEYRSKIYEISIESRKLKFYYEINHVSRSRMILHNIGKLRNDR